MRPQLLSCLLLASAALGVPSSEADAAFTTISGNWHCRITSGATSHKGAMILRFPSAPQFGVFDVKGAGYSTLFSDQAFAVATTPTQQLSFDSKGSIHGVIELKDITRTTTLGSLTIESGKVTGALDKLVLKGTIVLNDLPATKVKLVGSRLDMPTPAASGRSFDGKLGGKGVHATQYDIALYYEDKTAGIGVPPVLKESYPFLYVRSGGAASVDGAEVENFMINGLLVSDWNGQICGSVTTSEFGPGVLKGKFTRRDKATFKGTIETTSGRRVKFGGTLQSF